MAKYDPVENAWKIHQSLSDWTGKVDSKASFALTAESIVLGAVIGLSGTGRRFSDLHEWWAVVPFWLGVAALAASALLALSVVAPRMRSEHVKAESPRNFIYFGHLQHWQPGELANELTKADPLPVLCRQIVNMSRIAWVKHRRVHQSLYTAAGGAGLVAAAGILSQYQ
ncbi:Pycsar system effector family protein [Planomonospora corallina]|uniref:Pycsar system effector family protein n=1 Tax=Planomonospora corallina TaxID=1806052 RepID=A0ABV8HZQ1_9ACTN